MDISTATQIVISTTALSQETILQPVLGRDFVAGIDSLILKWRIVPLSKVTELMLETRPSATARVIRRREEVISDHFDRLAGQTLKCQVVSGTSTIGKLLEVETEIVWLQVDGVPRGIPLASIESVWLWKTINESPSPMPAFFEKGGHENEQEYHSVA